MCGGLSYRFENLETGEIQVRKAYFPIPRVEVPILSPSGVSMVQWGKRQGEDPEIDIPVTGWARIASLKAGSWNRYQPRRVYIPALAWMEKDANRDSHWFDMEAGTALLGVKIQANGRDFVYIVTRPARDVYAKVHQRMPMVVAVPEELAVLPV